MLDTPRATTPLEHPAPIPPRKSPTVVGWKEGAESLLSLNALDLTRGILLLLPSLFLLRICKRLLILSTPLSLPLLLTELLPGPLLLPYY